VENPISCKIQIQNSATIPFQLLNISLADASPSAVKLSRLLEVE